jgi:CMP/dCMP kinase
MIVVAIDGPAASGKSSVAKLVAEHLGAQFVNSGALYRAATWAVAERGISPDDAAAISAFMEGARVTYDFATGEIEINGHPASAHLRDAIVNANVSRISAVPSVRAALTTLLRRMADDESRLVMEGRDIGSVVFPNTPYKYYIDASQEVRARRRAGQGETDAVAQRDAMDSQRKIAPLKVPQGARVIDSSDLTIAEVAATIVGELPALSKS